MATAAPHVSYAPEPGPKFKGHKLHVGRLGFDQTNQNIYDRLTQQVRNAVDSGLSGAKPLTGPNDPLHSFLAEFGETYWPDKVDQQEGVLEKDPLKRYVYPRDWNGDIDSEEDSLYSARLKAFFEHMTKIRTGKVPMQSQADPVSSPKKPVRRKRPLSDSGDESPIDPATVINKIVRKKPKKASPAEDPKPKDRQTTRPKGKGKKSKTPGMDQNPGPSRAEDDPSRPGNPQDTEPHQQPDGPPIQGSPGPYAIPGQYSPEDVIPGPGMSPRGPWRPQHRPRNLYWVQNGTRIAVSASNRLDLPPVITNFADVTWNNFYSYLCSNMHLEERQVECIGITFPWSKRSMRLRRNHIYRDFQQMNSKIADHLDHRIRVDGKKYDPDYPEVDVMLHVKGHSVNQQYWEYWRTEWNHPATYPALRTPEEPTFRGIWDNYSTHRQVKYTDGSPPLDSTPPRRDPLLNVRTVGIRGLTTGGEGDGDGRAQSGVPYQSPTPGPSHVNQPPVPRLIDTPSGENDPMEDMSPSPPLQPDISQDKGKHKAPGYPSYQHPEQGRQPETSTLRPESPLQTQQPGSFTQQQPGSSTQQQPDSPSRQLLDVPQEVPGRAEEVLENPAGTGQGENHPRHGQMVQTLLDRMMEDESESE